MWEGLGALGMVTNGEAQSHYIEVDLVEMEKRLWKRYVQQEISCVVLQRRQCCPGSEVGETVEAVILA